MIVIISIIFLALFALLVTIARTDPLTPTGEIVAILSLLVGLFFGAVAIVQAVMS